MLKETRKKLALWVRNNKSQTKNNLIEYLQERICKYSNEEATPAEQVKGMNRLLRDIIKMPEEFYKTED